MIVAHTRPTRTPSALQLVATEQTCNFEKRAPLLIVADSKSFAFVHKMQFADLFEGLALRR